MIYPGAIGTYVTHFEDNEDWPGLLGATDGSIIEGAVAAFLFDLADAYSIVEPWDTLAFPGTYIADIVVSCKVNGLYRADGVDHLIFCFEQEVDSSLAISPHTYFPTRVANTYGQWNSAGTPPGWSQSAVRATWIRDLYGPPGTRVEISVSHSSCEVGIPTPVSALTTDANGWYEHRVTTLDGRFKGCIEATATPPVEAGLPQLTRREDLGFPVAEEGTVTRFDLIYPD